MRFVSFASAAFLVLSGCSKKKAEVPQSNQVVEPKTTQFRTSTQEDLSSKGNGSSDETAKGEATSSGSMKKRKGEVTSSEQTLEEETLSVESEPTESEESVEEETLSVESEATEETKAVKANKKTSVSLDEVHVLGRAGAAHSAVEKEAQFTDIESQLQVLRETAVQDLVRLDEDHEETKARTLGAIQAEIVHVDRQLEQVRELVSGILGAPFRSSEELRAQVAEISRLRRDSIPQLEMAVQAVIQRYRDTQRRLEESYAQTRLEIAEKYAAERDELEARQEELTRLPEGSVVGRAPWVL